jgi:hypothetical protein
MLLLSLLSCSALSFALLAAHVPHVAHKACIGALYATVRGVCNCAGRNRSVQLCRSLRMHTCTTLSTMVCVFVCSVNCCNAPVCDQRGPTPPSHRPNLCCCQQATRSALFCLLSMPARLPAPVSAAVRDTRRAHLPGGSIKMEQGKYDVAAKDEALEVGLSFLIDWDCVIAHSPPCLSCNSGMRWLAGSGHIAHAQQAAQVAGAATNPGAGQQRLHLVMSHRGRNDVSLLCNKVLTWGRECCWQLHMLRPTAGGHATAQGGGHWLVAAAHAACSLARCGFIFGVVESSGVLHRVLARPACRAGLHPNHKHRNCQKGKRIRRKRPLLQAAQRLACDSLPEATRTAPVVPGIDWFSRCLANHWATAAAPAAPPPRPPMDTVSPARAVQRK